MIRWEFERHAGSREVSQALLVVIVTLLLTFFLAFSVYRIPPHMGQTVYVLMLVFPALIWWWLFLGTLWSALKEGKRVKWSGLLDTVLGVYTAYVNLGWIAALFDWRLADYPFVAHVLPFTWIVFVVPLLGSLLIELFAGEGGPARRKAVEAIFAGGLIAVNTYILFF